MITLPDWTILPEVMQMSWNEELYKIYEYNYNRTFENNEPVMLPLYHSITNAQVEITINECGEFRGARKIEKKVAKKGKKNVDEKDDNEKDNNEKNDNEKDESETIIPATEASAGRTSNPVPMPFADKLIYIAGDYINYCANEKKSDNSKHLAYMEQLKQWADSEYSHKAVKALYAYIEKKCLISDLIKSGVLVLNKDTGKLDQKIKIGKTLQQDSFVRIIISSPEGVNLTWTDKTLYDSFIAFNRSIINENNKIQLCYASGKETPVTYNHPLGIRYRGDMVKLISSNDEDGFSYRGRFENKEQALSIGYEYSQKIHNALKWLIKSQGKTIGSLNLIVWASALQNIPKVDSFCNEDDEIYSGNDNDDNENDIPSTKPLYTSMLKKRILGYKSELKPDTNVMILGLSSTSSQGKGRLNISLYSQLAGSTYLENIEKWHKDVAWCRYDKEKKQSIIKSFGLIKIIECAFGIENKGKLECNQKIMEKNMLRLIPCVTERRPVPDDIVRNLYFKASNPLAYKYNHRIVLETACGMIRKQIIDKKKGDVSMAYNPNETNRSYLYGCLLAIADKAENESYNEEERNKRITNARRYWNIFSQRPYQTWCIIEEKIQPYFNKLGISKVKYNKWINEIIDKMDVKEFSDNSRLEPLYLLGYHHFTQYMYNKKSENKE